MKALSKDFLYALKLVLAYEGGYTNDPHDPGGETNLGILHTEYDRYRRELGLPTRSVKSLTRDEAADIYFRKYWVATGCDTIPGPLNIALFDSAVNTGNRQATLFLQRALGVVADGRLGPTTLAAARKRNPRTVAVNLLLERVLFYHKLNTFKYFGEGWLNRIARLAQALKLELPEGWR